LLAAVFFRAVSTVPRAEELAGFWVQPFPDGLKLLRRHIAAQAEQLGATAVPLTLNTPVFIVVVAVLKVLLRVASAARHGPNRQHDQTLTLFEFAMQLPSRALSDCDANTAEPNPAPSLLVFRPAQPESASVISAESSPERSRCARVEDRHHP